MKFKNFINEIMKSVISLPNNSLFHHYASDMVADLEDKYGEGCIEEYDVDDDKLFLTFGKHIKSKEVEAIVAAIKKMNK